MGWGEGSKKWLMTSNPNILKCIQQNRQSCEDLSVGEERKGKGKEGKGKEGEGKGEGREGSLL